MIRRMFTLCSVGVVVWLLLRWTEPTPSASPAEATFLLGFALLAATLTGEITEHLGLPRITGYILAGIVFGPHASALLTTRVLEPLGIFNEMAYAFIGLAAGAELRLATLRGRWKSIVLLIVVTSTVVITGVGASVYLLASAGGILGALAPLQVLAVAALVGVIAAARSPSSAIAVIAETNARGPFSETILGVSVAMDVVVICLFSVATALAGKAFVPTEPLDSAFVLTLVGTIVVSIALGVALGTAIGAYLKHRGPQIPLVVVGLCFLVYRGAEIAGHHLQSVHDLDLHLEPLLICAAAGFVIQNLSRHGEQLTRAMDSVALPVYVLFFTMAGAALDLGAVAASWRIALAIAACRIVMIMIGTWLATSMAGDPPTYRRTCWMGFVTQAGLSLALIAELESRYPGWGTRLATVLVAVVAINQLLGPAAFKMALDKVGETQSATRVPVRPSQ